LRWKRVGRLANKAHETPRGTKTGVVLVPRWPRMNETDGTTGSN
jgi:hypothetical protein